VYSKTKESQCTIIDQLLSMTINDQLLLVT